MPPTPHRGGAGGGAAAAARAIVVSLESSEPGSPARELRLTVASLDEFNLAVLAEAGHGLVGTPGEAPECAVTLWDLDFEEWVQVSPPSYDVCTISHAFAAALARAELL